MMRKVLLAGLLNVFLSAPAFASDQPVYDRVMKSQTIRCGYAEWPPFLKIDPNTKEISGLFRDLWEQIGKKLNLKIQWETIVGWGDITEAINSRKIDLFCGFVLPDAGRVKNMLFSRPVIYSPIFIYSRANDKRFDNNYEILNNPKYTVVGMEGTALTSMLNDRFPKAKTANVMSNDSVGTLLLNVTTGKGDITIVDQTFVNDYTEKNPNKIRRVQGPPLAILQNSVPVGIGETQIKNMIDTALTDMINDGTIAGLLVKYKTAGMYAPTPDVVIGK